MMIVKNDITLQNEINIHDWQHNVPPPLIFTSLSSMRQKTGKLLGQ